MAKEKTKITQELCRKVQLMLPGAQAKEVAGLLGISETTVSRIKTAGFSLEQYEKNNAARKEEAKKPERKDLIPVNEEEECEGQICMDLKPAEEQKQEMSDQAKMMRFLAGQVDKLIMKMDTMNNNICQILRKMDG